MNVVDLLAEQRVFPILRSRDADDAVATASAASRAGMRVVELTMSIPGVHDAARRLDDEGLVIGIGTIRTADEVRAAAEAGATFVVSFFRPEGFVAAARDAGIAAVPGAFTATEFETARADGADAAKLFPARLAAPSYLGDLRPLVPGMRIVVTGGLSPSPDSLRPWLAAGALALGLGGSLGSAAALGEDEVERRCRLALAAAASAPRAGSSESGSG